MSGMVERLKRAAKNREEENSLFSKETHFFIRERHDYDLAKELKANGVKTKEYQLDQPEKIEGLIFERKDVLKVLKVLGIPLEEAHRRLIDLETDDEIITFLEDDPEVLSRKVLFVGGNEIYNWQKLEPVLKSFAEMLELQIIVSHPSKRAIEPRNDPGRLYLNLYSAIEVGRYDKFSDISRAFHILLQDESGYRLIPTGNGIAIKDEADQVLGELIEGTLYILFNLPEVKEGASELMSLIMERFLLSGNRFTPEKIQTITKEIAVREFSLSEEKYINFCLMHRQNARLKTQKELEQASASIRDLKRSLIQAMRTESSLREELQSNNSVELLRTKLQAEFKKILQIPKVIKVVFQNNFMTVRTGMIYIVDEGLLYRIGQFIIHIDFDGPRAGEIKFSNLTLLSEGGNPHPQIDTDGYACFGNILDSITKLVADYKFADLIELLIAYLESYNPDDNHCKVDAWPLVKEEKEKKEAGIES